MCTAPGGGWVRAIREALGMSAAELGTRMGIVETSVLRLEQNEHADRVRVDTLRRAAQALECDLVYALVPRRPLQEMVDGRAEERARAFLGPAATRARLDDLIELIQDAPGLWRDDEGRPTG